MCVCVSQCVCVRVRHRTLCLPHQLGREHPYYTVRVGEKARMSKRETLERDMRERHERET